MRTWIYKVQVIWDLGYKVRGIYDAVYIRSEGYGTLDM